MTQQDTTAANRARRQTLWWAMLALSVVGLVVSVMLLRIHYKVHTQVDFHSFCGQGKTLNCDTVARSEHSVFAGAPLAAWGILGYTFSSLLALWGLRARKTALLPAGLALMLASTYSLGSLGLGLLSALGVGSLCVLCAITYGLNLLFVVVAFMQAARLGLGQTWAAPFRTLRERPGATLAVLGIAVSCLLVVGMGFPKYWRSNGDALPLDLPHGESAEGHWIGAEHPVLTIYEYSDYECPYCKESHRQLRKKLAAFSSKLRIVHRHYPLDQACNPDIKRPFHHNACRAALIAECAGRAGRFWEANDYLFEAAHDLATKSNQQVARDLGLPFEPLSSCMEREGKESLERDIQQGIGLKLEGTPSFLIEGKVYMGEIPVGVLDSLQGDARQQH
jgi:uncharacterized membrane protein/predicted DsbA family dithiol-disulfide isomerase